MGAEEIALQHVSLFSLQRYIKVLLVHLLRQFAFQVTEFYLLRYFFIHSKRQSFGLLLLCTYSQCAVIFVLAFFFTWPWIINSRLPKGGLLHPPVIFPNNFFGQPKVAKRLYVIYNNPITHLFTEMNRILGVPYGQGESSKFSVEGGW